MRRLWFRGGRKWLLLAGALVLLAVAAIAATPLRAHYHRSCARDLLAEWKTEAALQSLLEAERLAPDHAETQFWLARAHRRLGNFDRMDHHLSSARRLGFPKERIEREEILADAQMGRVAHAERHLTHLLQNPEDDGPDICKAYINGYCLNLLFQEALILLDAWAAEYPADSEQWVSRGELWRSRSEWDDGAEAYRKAVELAPTHFKARYGLAQCLLKKNEPGQAEVHFRQCLQLRPEHSGALVGLGIALTSQQQLEEARSLFRRAIEHDSDSLEARRALAELELNANRPRDAIRCIQPAAEQWPEDAALCYALAQAYQAVGDKASAQRHFDVVDRAERELGELEQLVKDVAKRPQDTDLRYQIGEKVLRYRSREEGVGWLKSVLLIDPRHGPTHALLADYYRKTGRGDLADQHRRFLGTMAEATDGP